jgi:cytoskeletal protein CcmA (bactofilin family)
MVQSLVTDEGSVFEGKCKMIGNTTSNQSKIKSETK